jgi:tRNA1Val (adenine37-N6)-methyltransferase
MQPFRFKQFAIHQDRCAMKIGTDGVLLGAWADVEGAQYALDIGTGSGVIAIMLGQRAPQMLVHGVEIDATAYEQAADNMRAAPWASRMQVFHAAIQDYAAAPSVENYDLIVSNPPFFTGGVFSYNQARNSVRHTVKLPHSDLLGAVRSLLSDQGRFCLVLPYIEGLRFQELASSYHLYCTRVTEVHSKAGKPIERLLMQFEKRQKDTQIDKLVILIGDNNEWTEEYRRLTGEFYLDI